MPARGFACRAARTKTAKHACESLIPPVVIQHPSLLSLHSHPVSRPIRARFFPGLARGELCIVWEFFIVRLQTNPRHRADFSFIRSSIPASRIHLILFPLSFSFFPFSFLYLKYNTQVHAPLSFFLSFLFHLIHLLHSFFLPPPLFFCTDFDFNDDVVLFRSTRFFFFHLSSIFFPLLVIV